MLRPLLWNNRFKHALEAALSVGVHLACYADDTLLMSKWEGLNTLRLAEVGVASVTTRIRQIHWDWRWQREKPKLFGSPPIKETAADMTCSRREMHPDPGHHKISWANTEQPAEIWGPLCLLGAEEGVAIFLGHLLPNIKGSEERTRRLYAGVIKFMVLYGVSIWASDLQKSRNSRNIFRCI